MTKKAESAAPQQNINFSAVRNQFAVHMPDTICSSGHRLSTNARTAKPMMRARYQDPIDIGTTAAHLTNLMILLPNVQAERRPRRLALAAEGHVHRGLDRPSHACLL